MSETGIAGLGDEAGCSAVFGPSTARLDRIIRLLTTDPDKHVRAMAAELVGKAVHTAPEAVKALEAVRDGDPKPGVRKKAGWYAPGGTIYERTARG